jgi:carboxypeptidase C (cathepsin A)
MLEFLQQFPDLQGRPFYITGESYAGKYIPWFSNYLVNQNAKLDKSSKLKINLKGIMIGNGIVNPELQYLEYFNFSSHHQLISFSDQQKLGPSFKFCQELLKKGATEQTYSYCETLITAILVNPITRKYKFNYYNITLPCITDSCYDDSKLIKFMRSEEVKINLEQRSKNWKMCKDDIYLRLMADQPINAAQKLVDVLEAGVQVMGYYGELDFICNWEGGLSWMNN